MSLRMRDNQAPLREFIGRGADVNARIRARIWEVRLPEPRATIIIPAQPTSQVRVCLATSQTEAPPAQGNGGDTVLHYVAKNRDVPAAVLLVLYGPDIHATTQLSIRRTNNRQGSST